MSLLQKEAVERKALIPNIVKYKLAFKLKKGPQFEGVASIAFELASKSAIFLELEAQSVEFIEINAKPIEKGQISTFWNKAASSLRIPADFLLPGQNALRIYYISTYFPSNTFGPISIVGQSQYIFTKDEPFWGHRLFPCFDQPDIKGKFEAAIFTPID